MPSTSSGSGRTAKGKDHRTPPAKEENPQKTTEFEAETRRHPALISGLSQCFSIEEGNSESGHRSGSPTSSKFSPATSPPVTPSHQARASVAGNEGKNPTSNGSKRSLLPAVQELTWDDVLQRVEEVGSMELPQRVAQETVDRFLSGDWEVLPRPRRSSVCLFLCGTRDDFQAERQQLWRFVFPQLYKICRRLDLELEVVESDLRWGVRDSRPADHETPALCIAELQRCKAQGLGPNFLCLLGQRYGRRPFPTIIPSDEFDVLLEAAYNMNASSGAALVAKWFQADNNRVPPVHMLLPIKTLLPDFEKPRSADRQRWQVEFKTLYQTIEAASSFLDPERRARYTRSVTAREVEAGVLNAVDTRANSFALLRKLQLSPRTLACQDAPTYIDTTESGESTSPDAEAAALVASLHAAVDCALQPANMQQVVLTSLPPPPTVELGSGVPQREGEEGACAAAVRSLGVRLGLRVVECAQERLEAWDELVEEVREHCARGKQLCVASDNVGPYLQIQQHLAAALANPLPSGGVQVIHGPPGSGKSTAMAVALSSWRRSEGRKAPALFRFCGTTPHSSTATAVLSSLIAQVLRTSNLPRPPSLGPASAPTVLDPAGLALVLHSLLAAVAPAVVGLDGLDFLVDNSATNVLLDQWLAQLLPPPPGVRLVLTVTSGTVAAAALRRTLPTSAFVAVRPLKDHDLSSALDRLLSRSARRLTQSQRGLITAAMEACDPPGTPLLLTQLVAKSASWASATPAKELSASGDVKDSVASCAAGCVGDTATRLLARRFGLLCAARFGLTRFELWSVLSCNDQVLAELFRTGGPRTEASGRTVPAIALSALIADLA
eukprot:CAMPEP_0114566320 /NCGR_PEP_ID=MMETSP0114-20121206/14820_1 /TAXON_ID=31324 /ORGANISM="Goniomonas sp, Strain m" /LENGTH=838 /DNA_ID=CAMNT_0001752705 /DNA_START=98 /DNA_END=2613 /DNA_ORIENTATION=+